MLEACHIDGCRADARYPDSGLCDTHYRRWARTGDPYWPGLPPVEPPATRMPTLSGGLCRDSPGEWVPVSEYGPEARAAIAVCLRCPVRYPCAQYAMANREVGIWGGTTTELRRLLRREAAR